ncbi:TRAP transporter large permease [Alkaliphilus peptidifermentans]|uniref:TRAP transporter, DctM subunit n=1 Tax=Alkaliphilus peptidifermentans DSM 18978 TaxID=1120976 RepID=A0A1G5JS40_9FIRM|nr:TRAP transporter large permease [Alkaliphilus peptidifermentans]SCY90974.1 TRAP transporter, DctM subunit [Alkaliphilus peptidifermentans DSM 18978]
MLLMAITMFTKLMMGFPFMVVLLGSLLLYIQMNMPNLNMHVVVQQVITGMIPPALVAVPMFILAANIITAGQAANRLIRMVKSFVGHIPGGLAITTNASCTLFGAVSGSTQATVAAIGGTMRPMLLDAGYPSSFTLGLIINSSDIAFLIPPSIGFIVYGVVTGTSVGRLFLAGVGPGILIFLLFSIYCYIYAKRNNIGSIDKASWTERKEAIKGAILVMGFPVIIIGGIYGGIFSPTEAAAVSVAYAILLEGLIYKTLSFNSMIDHFLQTGVITGVVFILVGAGNVLSWILSFLRIPQQYLPRLFGQDPSQLYVVLIVVASYFIACMFVDPIVAIYVLSPIFAPYVISTGIDPVLLGVLVTLQAAIGSATPPFGCDIFTAQLIFRRPYLEIIGHTPPFVLILLLVTALLVMFPQIALFLPNMAFM